MSKITINEMSEAVGGSVIGGGTDETINTENIITDSRLAIPGSVFFALKGSKVDGHDYILDVFSKGAVCAVCEKTYFSTLNAKLAGSDFIDNNCNLKDKFIILTEDVRKALIDLAVFINGKFGIPTIAVTGSVGKTSTKEFIYNVLSEKYSVHKTEGNLNTDIGVPLTVFKLNDIHEMQVLEFGMSAQGEIKELSEMICPTASVITNIGYSHIEKLGSRENIKKAKFEILEGLKENGFIALDADEPLTFGEKGKTGYKELFYGCKNQEADCLAYDIKYDYDLMNTVFKVRVQKSVYDMKINVVGSHNVKNALAAILIGIEFGLTIDEIKNGLLKFRNVLMRQNIYRFNGINIIDDCYNASFESMCAAFEVVASLKENRGGRSVAVLGDILETGAYAAEIHSRLAEKLIEYNIDMVFLYGTEVEIIYRILLSDANRSKIRCEYFTGKKELAESLKKYTESNDTVLFKASRGIKMEEVIEMYKM